MAAGGSVIDYHYAPRGTGINTGSTGINTGSTGATPTPYAQAFHHVGGNLLMTTVFTDGLGRTIQTKTQTALHQPNGSRPSSGTPSPGRSTTTPWAAP